MNEEDDFEIFESDVNYKSITCNNLPELLLDKQAAKKYFGKYGKYKRFILRPKQRQCVVEYESQDSAQKAFMNAGQFEGDEFVVTYSEDASNQIEPTVEESIPVDVQAELDAMKGSLSFPQRTARFSSFNKLQEQKPTTKPVKGRQQGENGINIKIELEAILRRQGVNDEEKYKILDARDKLLRLTTVRSTDIKSVVSTKGTCPDMCPEKERLMREYQHQVSNFEMESNLRNTMNHKLAIKEYSRSSADQEVPLAHELRSEPILKMTMTYLLHKIMDLCEDEQINKGDWYHFVWDRTRSIRKDITQQELCSLNSVELVEQCARFHIHCASRLIAEHSADFDQKINTENLTKCLQTLKYMYHDLRIKNINCPNEAEFRAYIILLNLSDGNFLWEMNQLPEDIVKSPEVKMALSFYFAMESNNYVKFFKLVKQTTYLCACILIRYFTQIRVRAMSTLIRAYTRSFLPKDSVAVPLTYLTELLGFDSTDDAVSMFRYYGLNCDEDKVHLDRHMFLIPEFNYTMERSLLIESKRTESVGKTICGKNLEPLTIFENHEIHESFDENGYLKMEAWNAEDQLRGEDAKNRKSSQKQDTTVEDGLFKKPLATASEFSKQQQLKGLLSVSKHENQQSNDTTDTTSIFSFKPDLEKIPIFGKSTSNFFNTTTNSPREGSNIFSKPEIIKPVEKPVSGNIFSKILPSANVSSNIFAIPKTSSTNNQRESIFNRLDKTTVPVTSDSTNIINNQISQFQFNQVKEADEKIFIESAPKIKVFSFKASDDSNKLKFEEEENQKQLQIENEKLQRLEQQKIAERELKKKIDDNSMKLFNEILSDIIDEEIFSATSQSLETFIQIEAKAIKLCNNIIDELIKEEIKSCCNKLIAIKCRNQELLEKYFAVWLNRTLRNIEKRSLMEAIPSWTVSDSIDESASKVAHPGQNENLHFMRRYRLGVSGNYPTLRKTQEITKIDIINVLSKQLEKRRENSNRPGYLNHRKYLKFVISIPDENEESPGFNSFINKWLENNIKSSNSDDNKLQAFFCQSNNNLALAVRKTSGIEAKNEMGNKISTECNNADAIIFLMSCGNFSHSYQRLRNLVKISKIYKPIPVAIIVYNTTADEGVVEEELDLINLQIKEIISHYSIFGTTELIQGFTLTSLFEKSLKFLVRKEDSEHETEMRSLTSFLSLTIGLDMFERFFESCRLNPLFQKYTTVPFYVVELWNELIDRLIDFIGEDLQCYPEFPEELKQFVPKLLSDIPVQLEHFASDWKSIGRQQRIKNFLKKLKLPKISFERPNEIDKLESWLFNYASRCIVNNDVAGVKLGYAAIKTLLEKLNDSALADLPISGRLELLSWMDVFQTITMGVLNHYWNIDFNSLPCDIYYNRKKFIEFISDPWWLNTKQLKSIRMSTTLLEELEPADRYQNSEDILDIDVLIGKGIAAVNHADIKVKKFQKRSSQKADLDQSINESLYKMELDKKLNRMDETNSFDKEIYLNQTADSPNSKKFKSNISSLDDGTSTKNCDSESLEAIMSRAQSIITRIENRFS